MSTNTEKLRVLMGMPSSDSLGGPIYCEPPFVESLRSMGVAVDEEVYVYGDESAGANVIGRISRVLDAARRMRRRVRQSDYDIVHLNTSFDEKCVVRDLIAMAAIGSSRVPIFLKMHGSIERFLKSTNPFWGYLKRRVFKNAASIGVLSSEEFDNFVDAGCTPEKLVIVGNAVRTGEFTHDEQFPNRHSIAPHTPMLMFSSRFVATKGLLDLIAACGELKQTGRDFVLFCLGDGPVRGEAEQLVKQLDLAGTVRFTGYIAESETAAFHAGSTIFVFPTYHDEGFPLVLLKSLAAGMPIITTRIRAAADYLNEPDNCLWVNPREPHDLAKKITRLLDDNALRSTMSANNHRLAEQFSPANIAQEYVKLYEMIAQKEVRP